MDKVTQRYYQGDEDMEDGKLEELIKKAKEDFARLSPEEKAKMIKQQAEGWARAELQWAKDFAAGKCERD